MNTIKISKIIFSVLFFWSTIATAQNLTISTSGGDVGPISGTNWGISDNVLYVGSSGSASINASVITNHLQNTGDLTINLPGQLNVARNIYINNSIAYSGSSARTLTFQSGNDIVFANAVGITSATASLNIVLRSATTPETPNNGSVKMDGINIDTKGGHLWVGGGASTTTWNGLNVGNTSARTYLDDVAGISVVGSSIATNGGNISMYAQSFNTGDADGINYGINFENSVMSSGTGTIYFAGGVYGQYTNGTGMRVYGTNTTSITSTTGAIYIYGYGTDSATNGNAGRTATTIQGTASIKSESGAISVIGDAAFAAIVNDKEGLMIASGAAICSKTGNITLRGTNTLETSGQYSNSIRFTAADVANSIRIGYDGTNAYSGNISIEGNSIYQRNANAGAGSIAVQTTGTLTIQPTGTAFTYMRASDGGTLTFDNDWNFGTNLGGFVYGKSTNTTALTYSNALATSGAITFNCSDFTLGDGINLSTSTASDITINANGSFDTFGSTRRTISSANGNIIIHADKDANASGQLSIDYLTFNPGTGATIIRGETVNFAVGSVNGPYINGTGSFTFQSSDASFGSTINTSWFEIDQDNNGIGGLTLGKIGNTTDIQQNTSLTVAGPVNMYGGNIVSTASLTATNSDVSLYASTAVTQTSPIIAAGLSLNGTGTFTLTNTSNNFTTLAGGAVGSLLGTTQIVDVSGGLTIGTVGSTTGLTGSNTIRVETLAGDLTLAGNISTTSTSTDAVILTAAKSTAIGVPTGGDILVSGSPTITMGTGAIAKLFSGYDVTSTGLTTLAGGASNARYNYDETTTTYNPVLSANNKYAIYRTALGYGDLTIVSSGGDAEGTTWTYANGVIKTTSGAANILNSVVQTKLNSANLSIEANKIIFNANVTGTTSNALNIRSKTHIVNSSATTITTAVGDVLFATNVDDASDNESIDNGYIQFENGLTVTTNGGNITLGGGDAAASSYALGASTARYEGIRVAAIINLNSGGGNIILRGKSYNINTGSDAWGVGFMSLTTGSINSGTGTVLLDGYSQSGGGAHSSGLFSNGDLAITSANTTADAIKFIGKSTGTYGESWGVEAENALSLIATSEGGGITMSSSQQNTAANHDVVLRGETNILAKSGPINLLGGQSGGIVGGQLWLSGNYYIGSKASSAVTSSSSNITLQYDYYNWIGGSRYVATSGTVDWKPVSASFTSDVYVNWFNWNQNSQTMTGLTVGKLGCANWLYHQTNAITVAGPISYYGGYVGVSGNLTSSANGDILLKGISGGNDVEVSSTISKTAGTGTLTMQSNGRANFWGPITASGTGVLNVVLWSDYDNINNYGGSTFSGAITTNGGHVWMGGSNSNGGSYTWNGLTVGDGPSVGGSNANAVDFFNNVTTNGGDCFVWAGNGNGGVNGIASNGTWTIDTGSGDITLVSSVTSGTIGLTTTGLISLLPNGGSYASALTFGGTVTSGNFTFNTSHYNGIKINSIANVGGLTLGKYEGLLTAGTPVLLGNSSNITFSSAATVGGPIIVYGGTIALDANLTTTNNGDISLYTDAAIGGLTAVRTITAAGSFNYIPRSDFFSAPVTYPITNLNLTSAGLLIGKPTNTAAITFGNATTIAGPITAYGGTVTLNANLTTTNNGNISLYSDNPLGGLSTARTLIAAGAFKYIPRTTTFTADVTYPIANLTATSTGLTIGNTTNDKNITITQEVIGGAGIELYGNNLNINANLKTTSSANMYLKGNATIAAEKYIESNGNFTHDGNLTFKSDANGTATFGSLGGAFTTVSGTATVERYVPAKRGWRLLTAPLKGATNTTIPSNWQGITAEGLLLFSPATYQSNTMTGYTTGGGSPNIWKYNNGWQSIPNLTVENLFTSTVNNSFLVFATGPSDSANIVADATATTLKPKGDLITGNVTHTLTANEYKLIANPYASPINTVSLVAANTGSTIWMVDPTLGTYGGYAAYDGSNWTPAIPTTSDAYIQSGQGFFVRNANNATFTISESHKVSGNSNTWFQRSTGATQTTESADKIRVLLYKQDNAEWKLADGVLAVNSTNGNSAVDETDTNKMTNFNENIMFRNGTTNLAIEYSAIPQVGYVQPMRLTATTIQPYQLRLFTENYTNTSVTPLLEDTVAGTFTPIPTDGSVLTMPFTGIAATSTVPDQRFRIVYQKEALNNENFTPLWASVYPNPVKDGVLHVNLNTIGVSTNFTLTNLVGQLMHQGKLENIQNAIALPQLPEGIYLLSIIQEGKQYNSKIYIK